MAASVHTVLPSPLDTHASPATKYTLVASRPLPSIDCSKTLKSVLLPPTALRRWNSIIHHFRRQINLASAIGMIGAVVPIVPASVGAWCACLGFALQCIGLISALSSLRYDVVAILVHSFEFWYFSMTNLMCSIAVMLCYGDWRGAGCPMNAVGVQVILLIDAFYRPLNLAIVGSVAASIMYLSLLILLSLDLVDRQRDFRLASSRSHHLTVVDVATNASATMVFLLLRNVYRKRVALRQHGASSTRDAWIDRDNRLVRRVFLLRAPMAIAALVVTGAYAVLVLSLLHRHVIHQLRHSFDYLFVSAQLTIAHICVCDMLSWDARSLSILSLWLWLHVVISVDALLPPMRRALGISRMQLASILIAAAALGGVFCVELIVVDPSYYRNHPYISMWLQNRRIELRVTPLLFGRVFSLSWWIARLLWRIQDRRDDELIMLQGKVEFEDLLLLARKQQLHRRPDGIAGSS